MTVTGYIILSLVFLAIWFINRPEKKSMKDIKSPDLDKMQRMSMGEVREMYRDSLKKLKGEIEWWQNQNWEMEW